MFKEKFLTQKDPEGLKGFLGILAPLASKYLKDKTSKSAEKATKEEELKASSKKDLVDLMGEYAAELFHEETPEEKISTSYRKNSDKMEDLKKENERLKGAMLFSFEAKLLMKAYSEKKEEIREVTDERKELIEKWNRLKYIHKGHKRLLGEKAANERTSKEKADLTEKFVALKLKQEKLLTIEDWPEFEVVENNKREIKVRAKPNSKVKINIVERLVDIVTLSSAFTLTRKNKS